MVLSSLYNYLFGTSIAQEDEVKVKENGEEKQEKEKIGDEPVFVEDTRQCSSCMQDLPISQFQVRRRKKRALRRSKCKECVANTKSFHDHQSKLQEKDLLN